MANSYTKLYVHLVFAVHKRENTIPRYFNNDLQKYITGILDNKGDTLIAINNEPDHIHILCGFKPSRTVADIVRDIKSNSSRFITERGVIRGHFAWQEGYAAFTCSASSLQQVSKYIESQQEHHKKRTFREEYLDFLEKAGIGYDPNYLFEFYDAESEDNAAPTEL